MATTLHTHDFIGRALQNDNPGVTDPVLDYIGREITEDETDFLGRALQGAPTPGSVSGVVTDSSTTDPIEGATVTVDGEQDTTTVDGEYTVAVLPGTYTVTATADGYQQGSQPGVEVGDGQHVTGVDIALAPEDGNGNGDG